MKGIIETNCFVVCLSMGLDNLFNLRNKIIRVWSGFKINLILKKTQGFRWGVIILQCLFLRKGGFLVANSNVSVWLHNL